MGSEALPRRPGRGTQSTDDNRPAESAGSLLAKGLAAFGREDEEAAIAYFLDALQVAPANLRLHYLTALCAQLLGDEDTVENIYASAASLNEHHPYTIACEAVRFMQLANYSRAEALFEHALRQMPDDVDLLVGLGILHEFAGDDEKGINAFRRALELDPLNIRARLALGVAYAMAGDYEQAYEQYVQAKTADPQTENPHQRLGRDYYLEGMTEEAAGEFAAAITEEPDEPGAWFYLMDCYRRQGRLDEALDCYSEIRRRFDDDPEATSGFWEYLQMHREAIAALELLCERYPEDAGIRVRLSGEYQAVGRLDDAAAVAQDAVDRSGNDPAALELLARLEFERGNWQAAASAARQALAADPTNQPAAKVLADALVFLGDGEGAQRVIDEMEAARNAAWRRYQRRFSGQDRPESDS